MIANPSEQAVGARFIVLGAAAVVVVWGLHFLEPILLPFSLALFLSVLALPVLGSLCSRGVPNWLAVLVSMSAVVGIFALFGFLASASFSDLQAALPRYQEGFQQLRADWTVAIESSVAILEPGDVDTLLERLNIWDPARFFELAGTTLGRAASFVGQGLLVLLIMVFVLAEAAVFPDKLEAIFGDGMTGEERMRTVVVEVQQYLGIKTLVSLATGIVIGGWCWILGLDFAVLLGMIAFALNYIPTVGSIIAGVPAVVLSLIITGGSFAHALLVAGGYVVVNTVFGNFIEPSLMGRRLGLSTLVVILSLVFWGWVWGPVGALLSVPLTMIVKIWLENTQDLRWIALLLDKQARPLHEEETPPAMTPLPTPSDSVQA
ncbi:MAG: AI-2E family transporter [Longimicrobiales bacterium]|nr:AI-2E family transporter [Longimicrobiales bacterium]